ncbi:hypothetical protein ABIF83_001454 [Bradyrhizobium ottawaense]
MTLLASSNGARADILRRPGGGQTHDALFDIERDISGLVADERRRIRQEPSKPLLEELESWLREQRTKLSRSSAVLKPINYMLKRWEGFARVVDDGKICISNNAAERALRGLALGRRSWLFACSDRGGERAAVMNALIMTARINDIDPKAWLADMFGASQIILRPVFMRSCPGPGYRRNTSSRPGCLIHSPSPLRALESITRSMAYAYSNDDNMQFQQGVGQPRARRHID